MAPRKRGPKKIGIVKPRNIQVRVSEDTYQIFTKIAEEEGRSLSNLIRYYLEKIASEYKGDHKKINL